MLRRCPTTFQVTAAATFHFTEVSNDFLGYGGIVFELLAATYLKTNESAILAATVTGARKR